MQLEKIVASVNQISRDAGAAMLEVYHREGEVKVSTKSDNSPLTEADMAAHHIIEAGLQALTPEMPILSEESDSISWAQRKSWSSYWLVDPLDGTKEFINRNGEFTVNIALIEEGAPVLGVVYVPVLDILYYGTTGGGAFKQAGGVKTEISTSVVNEQTATLRVVASRNHRGEALDDWIQRAEGKFAAVETLSMGSSLKICLVAEGKADIYPRLALTAEWDTAAAQAVLEAAGGILTDEKHKVYRYNQKENILNPFFFAVGDKAYPWQEL